MNNLPTLDNSISGFPRLDMCRNNGLSLQLALTNVSFLQGLAKRRLSERIKGSDIFTPLRIVNKIDLMKNLSDTPGYAWSAFKKDLSPSVKTSCSSLTKSLASDGGKAEGVGETLKIKKRTRKQTDSCEIETKSEDLIKDFQNKPWMQDSRESKGKKKSSTNKKLAVRSDVVNKTLLRALKRYYTAKFEREQGGFGQNKDNSNKAIHQRIRDFATEIYEGDKRFSMEEFSEVTLKDLSFYMGILINPSLMKKSPLKPQDRIKIQNFYNCLYNYSHKKLQKLFKSKVLHFMFSKFAEEGPLDELLRNDSTLKKNPEVYLAASKTFVESKYHD